MVDKVFHGFEDRDVGAEAVIGGLARHRDVDVPAGFVPPPNLVVPARPDTVDAFRAWRGDRPLVLEVGAGKGRFLVSLASRRPDVRFLGFETRLGLCAHVLARAAKAGLDNVAMAWGDARFNLPLLVPPAFAVEAYLLFPDPWWKRRHARRRHGAAMSRAIADALAPGGRLVLKSDIAEYLDAMVAAFGGTGDWDPTVAPDDLPLTDRQARASFQGTNSFTAAFRRR